MGKVFGPVMMVWFATIAVLGLWHISDRRGCIKSVNPYYAIHFFGHETHEGVLVARLVSSWSSRAAKRCTPTWATSAGDPSCSGGTRMVLPSLDAELLAGRGRS